MKEYFYNSKDIGKRTGQTFDEGRDECQQIDH